MPRAQTAALRCTVFGLAVLLTACIQGPVTHADLLMTIRNDSRQTLTVRWKSTALFGRANLAFVDPGTETTSSVGAGTYTLSIDRATIRTV